MIQSDYYIKVFDERIKIGDERIKIGDKHIKIFDKRMKTKNFFTTSSPAGLRNLSRFIVLIMRVIHTEL